MSPTTPTLDYLNGIDRYRFLTILNAADKNKEYQFLKQAAMMWLINYPGDLYVQFHQAMAYLHLDRQQQAVTTFEDLIEKDPLFVEPVQVLSKITNSPEKKSLFFAIGEYLTNEKPPAQLEVDWLRFLWEGRKAFSKGDWETTMMMVHQSLVNEPPSALPAILHLKAAYKLNDLEMLNNLSEIYYEKWPKCLQINILKAIAEIEQDEEFTAVERLHWVAAHDSVGQVIQRLLGPNHRFKNLWPDQLTIYFDLPIPASVTRHLGWNQLPDGVNNAPDSTQELRPLTSTNLNRSDSTQKIHLNNKLGADQKESKTHNQGVNGSKEAPHSWATEADFQEIQQIFSNLAKKLKKPDLDRAENRFPVYVVMTSRKQLDQIYGPNTAEYIHELLTELVGMVQRLPDWGSVLFYPDDPGQMAQCGLKPINATDAWQTKLALADLDHRLEKQGEMIGALLIVGGPEIIPYHHLPNPTQDNDHDVPSDNPYGTIDENYFIPQWPVGRLPGETGSDAGLLLQQIRSLIYQYQQRSKSPRPVLNFFSVMINNLARVINRFGLSFIQKSNLGYSAEVWRAASTNVFRTIGNAKDLHLSPPTHAKTIGINYQSDHRLGYFNLHGVEDGPNWYGQKDFSSISTEPDYPIALSPELFTERTPALKLVLSEACYGAHIINKKHEDALSLKFIDSGTTSFIGSTCIAYGSITPPLIAADFLADVFWQNIIAKQPAGYALMQAKLSLAEEMTRTQGFLDGEDQKTILSFILFGDPLAVYDSIDTMPKPLLRSKIHPAVRTISDSDMEHDLTMPKNVRKQVKKVMDKYLPGLNNAEMHVNKSVGFQPSMSKTIHSDRYVVTLQKSIEPNTSTTHHHFARMTFDDNGKLVKFSASR